MRNGSDDGADDAGIMALVAFGSSPFCTEGMEKAGLQSCTASLREAVAADRSDCDAPAADPKRSGSEDSRA